MPYLKIQLAWSRAEPGHEDTNRVNDRPIEVQEAMQAQKQIDHF
jgi:hypothetical protein